MSEDIFADAEITYLPETITTNKPTVRVIPVKSIAECEAGMIDLEDKAAASAALAKMSDVELSTLADKIDVVTKFCTRLKEEIARRVDANGGEWCNFVSKESSGGRVINAVKAAFDAVSDVVDAEEYLSCCTVSVLKLEKECAEKMIAYGMAKTKKEAVEMLRETLGDLIVERPAKRTIIHR